MLIKMLVRVCRNLTKLEKINIIISENSSLTLFQKVIFHLKFQSKLNS